jgi:hypothetical protein
VNKRGINRPKNDYRIETDSEKSDHYKRQLTTTAKVNFGLFTKFCHVFFFSKIIISRQPIPTSSFAYFSPLLQVLAIDIPV